MNLRAVTRVVRRAGRAINVALHVLTGALIVHGLLPVCERWSSKHAERKRRAMVQWWARRLCRLFRLQLRIRGTPAAGPALYVVNHVSWLDIPCLLALIEATFVAKQEVARWPVIGGLAAQVDTIFLPRGEGQTPAVAERMMWHLARRCSVILFPEGTTTDGATVRPFHSRLFQAAIRTGTPVQPVAIRYTDGTDASRVAPFIGDDDLLRHIWRLLGEERLVAHVHICPARIPGPDRRALARQTRAQVCAALGVETEEAPALARARFGR